MRPDYRALSFTAGDICQVFTIIHKEVLGQYGRTSCLLQDVKVFLYIRISVRPVGPAVVTGEVLESFIADTGSKFISFSPALGSVAALAPCIEPFRAVSGGIDVNADKNHVLSPIKSAGGVYA